MCVSVHVAHSRCLLGSVCDVLHHPVRHCRTGLSVMHYTLVRRCLAESWGGVGGGGLGSGGHSL